VRPKVVILAIVQAATLLALVGCGRSGSPEPVSDREARDVLAEVVRFAREGTLLEHCGALGSPELTCASQLLMFGADNVPAEPPTVVRSVEVPPSGANASPGRLLVLCGTDGGGREFQTGFLIYRYPGDRFAVPYPVYWSGTTVVLLEAGRTATTAREPDEPLAECRAAGVFN